MSFRAAASFVVPQGSGYYLPGSLTVASAIGADRAAGRPDHADRRAVGNCLIVTIRRISNHVSRPL